MGDASNSNINNKNHNTPKENRGKIGWKSYAKWGAFVLVLVVILLSFFLLAFPIARSYTVVYAKRIALFLNTNLPVNHIPFTKPLSATSFKVHGIDVSHHNSVVIWNKIKYISGTHDSISFVFIKATEGGNHTDPRFFYNWRFSKPTNLMRGAYHYYKPNVDAIKQAEWFTENVTLQTGDLPPVIDVEESRFSWNYSLSDEVFRMAKYLENFYHVKPIIYTSHNFYEIFFNNNQFEEFPFWIARYNYHHRLSTLDFWEFWQHSEKGIVNGIVGDVDVNVFAGSNAELRKLTVGSK